MQKRHNLWLPVQSATQTAGHTCSTWQSVVLVSPQFYLILAAMPTHYYI